MPAKISRAASAVIFVLASNLPVDAQSVWKAITNKAEYVSHLAERDLNLAGGGETYRSHANGRVSGTVQGAPYKGSWIWRDGTVCFDGAAKGRRPVKACAVVSVSGDIARFAWVGWRTFDYNVGGKK